jgi:hypothetical protein
MTQLSTDDRLARLEVAVCDLHALTGWWRGGQSPTDEQQAAAARLDALVADVAAEQQPIA